MVPLIKVSYKYQYEHKKIMPNMQ